MEKIKKYLNKELFLLVVTHLFLADATFVGIILMFLLVNIGIVSDKPNALRGIFFIFNVVILAKFTYLPVIYNYMLKHSKTQFVTSFAKKIRKNSRPKIICLVVSILPVFTYITSFFVFNAISGKQQFNYIGYFSTLIYFAVILGVFGSYLFLFLFWFVEDIFLYFRLKNQNK